MKRRATHIFLAFKHSPSWHVPVWHLGPVLSNAFSLALLCRIQNKEPHNPQHLPMPKSPYTSVALVCKKSQLRALGGRSIPCYMLTLLGLVHLTTAGFCRHCMGTRIAIIVFTPSPLPVEPYTLMPKTAYVAGNPATLMCAYAPHRESLVQRGLPAINQ